VSKAPKATKVLKAMSVHKETKVRKVLLAPKATKVLKAMSVLKGI
jgi:hypothetical protein